MTENSPANNTHNNHHNNTHNQRRSVSGRAVLLAIVVISAALYWLMYPSPATDERPLSLPWQIETHADGTSTVFGIRLEVTTVSELLRTLGIDYELAIISDSQDRNGLEIYYAMFRSGPLQGKLIASVQADSDTLEAMQARASSASYTGSGGRKFLLNGEDLARVQSWPIASLSLIPAASLDEGIILSRFGEPETRRQVSETLEHFLYPALGLDIALNDDGKELLQYVAPRNFSSLSQPLQNLPDWTPEP